MELEDKTIKPTDNIEHSDVIKHTLYSLINVASTKTSEDYAWITIRNLLKGLEENYGFLRYISMKELDLLQNTQDDMTIISKINEIESTQVGRAIQHIVEIYKKHLGKKAGYFFMQEFKYNLGEDYHSVIKKMGVDLRLAELQDELGEWDVETFQIKDDSNCNIAFIKKTVV